MSRAEKPDCGATEEACKAAGGCAVHEPDVCPHCTIPVVDLDEHLKTCIARKEDPLADARRLLAEDQQRRMQACNAEIEQVLAKHGMRLQISQPTVTIVPAD